MPTLKKKFLIPSGVCLLLLVSFALIINSCKKDLKDHADAGLDPAIAQAKAWYESTYPQNNNATLAVQGKRSGRMHTDFNQLIKPNWQLNARYKRFNKDVIEMPVDSSATVKFKLRNDLKTYNKDYTRGYYLFLKADTGYIAYIMMIVADSAYVKGDKSKLAHNTYRKRDADFSGMVLYFTPKGQFLKSYLYKNGSLVKPPVKPATQSNTLKANSLDDYFTNCVAWYWVTEYDDGSETWEYLYATCDGDGGGGGGGGTGPASPCTTPGTQSIKGNIHVNSLDDDGVGDGGGFPPPPPNPTSPSNCQPMAIIDSINAKYICAKNVLAQLPKLKDSLSALINKTFNSAGSKDITFKDVPASQFKDPKEDGECTGYNISLSQTVLANASGEYILATMFHEALHAFLNLEYITLGQSAFDAKYPDINVVQTPYIDGMLKYKYMFKETNQVSQVSSDPQHRTMADYFVDKMIAGILAYNPSFPADRAKALARYGIFNDTSIEYMNDAERDKTKGNSVGIPCP